MITKFVDFNEIQSKYFNFSFSNENYGRYLNKVLNRKNRLTQDECVKLIIDVQSKNEKSEKSLEKLVISFQSVVFLLAKKYCNNYYFFDFMSEANFGLIKAIETYNTNNQQATFLTYAINCILTHTMHYSDGNVVSLNGKPINFKVKRFIEKFYIENGYNPSDEIILENFPDVKKFEIQRIEHSDSTFISLDGFDKNDDTTNIKNQIELEISDDEDLFDDDIDFSMDKNIYLDEINKYYENEINKIKSKRNLRKSNSIPSIFKEKYVIEHLYGLNGNNVLSVEDLAKLFDCTPQMVYNIKLKAIQKLKDYFLQKETI